MRAALPNQARFGRLCWEVQDCRQREGGRGIKKTADTGTLALKERLANEGQASTEGEPEEALHNDGEKMDGRLPGVADTDSAVRNARLSDAISNIWKAGSISSVCVKNIMDEGAALSLLP